MHNNGNLLVTIFSDASYYAHTAGFSFWYKSEHYSGEHTGHEPARSPCHAELIGILRALERAIDAHMGIPIAFVIQCDSVQALGCILAICPKVRVAKTSPHPIHPVRKMMDGERQIAQTISGHILNNSFLKHVKGHSKRKDTRSSINRMNDARAKRAMLEAVKNRNQSTAMEGR